MARAKTAAATRRVNAENLAGLGAERLAELLMAVAKNRPELKRRLRLELAAEHGAEALAGEIDKRLTAFETSRGRVSWRQKSVFLRDIETQRGLIAGPLAALDRQVAVERLWRLMDAARPLGARLRQPADLDAVFAAVAADLGGLIAADEAGATDRLIESLLANPSGWAAWVPALLARTSPAFAAEALARSARTGETGAAWAVLTRLLADAAGDVERYRESFGAAALKTAPVAAEVARRYLAAGQVETAGELLRAAAPAPNWRGKAPDPDPEWEAVWIDFTERSGRPEEAQAARWAAFERTLSLERARDFTRRLADFDDVEAERRAFDHAAAHADFELGLAFLMGWPALPEAAAMIAARAGGEDVDPQKAEAWSAILRTRQPRAAQTLLRRGAATAQRRRQAKIAARLNAEADDIAV